MKKFKFPNAFIIVFTLMIIVALMTYVVPAGRYEFIKGTKIIDAKSFHYVAQNSTTLWGFIDSIFKGMMRSAPIILFTFVVGGYFNVLIATKAFDRFISLLVDKLGNSRILIIPVLMLVMSVLGAVGIMANPVVAVVPIGLILAKQLQLDQIVAVAVTFLAAYAGYAVSPVCPMTVQTAQKIAEVPIMSGFGYRTIAWVIITVVTILYVMHYAKKVWNNPEASTMGEEFVLEEKSSSSMESFRLQDALVLLGLIIGLGIYTYGSFRYRWGLTHMAGAMFCVAVFGATVARMGAEGFVQAFLDGARKMCFSALLIGLATSTAVIMTEANILHPLVYGTAQALALLPKWFVTPVMFYANMAFNFFVSSGSGQAAIVMPIMSPLADVVGVTRQMAINAFQYGDGLSNVVYPSHGTMMASIAIAGIRYNKWLKFVFPLFSLWVVIGTVLCIVGVAIGE